MGSLKITAAFCASLQERFRRGVYAVPAAPSFGKPPYAGYVIHSVPLYTTPTSFRRNLGELRLIRGSVVYGGGITRGRHDYLTSGLRILAIKDPCIKAFLAISAPHPTPPLLRFPL